MKIWRVFYIVSHILVSVSAQEVEQTGKDVET